MNSFAFMFLDKLNSKKNLRHAKDEMDVPRRKESIHESISRIKRRNSLESSQ